MFIRSERLFLRPGWPEDWEEVLARIGDEGLIRNLASAPWPYTADDARDFLSLPEEPRLPRFLVTVPGSDGARLVGSIGLMRDGDDVELGYWIAPDSWGLGYATEAVRAVLGLARALGHGRIKANHFADNPASGRVLRKVGFQPTGQSAMLFSRGRGAKAPALAYVAVLDEACGGDDGDGGMGGRVGGGMKLAA